MLLFSRIPPGIYRPWSQITRGSLEHAIAELGLSLSDAQAEHLMKSYDALRAFPDVTPALAALAKNEGVDAYIFSNGTDEMVEASIKTSPDLKDHAGLFKGLVTVHGLSVFKPSKKVYDHLLEQVGKANSPSEVWLVTSNPFDVVGARAVGLNAAWIDRIGRGWVDRLGDVIGDIRPTVVATGVEEAIGEILAP